MNRFHTSDPKKWVILKFIKQKKFVLFGVGRKARKFFDFHEGLIPFDIVVDNDVEKQKCTLGEVVGDLNNPQNEVLKINSVDILRDIDDEDIYIFIANAKPDIMIDQIKKAGKTHYITFSQWEHLQESFLLNQKIEKNKIIFYMYMHGAHEKAITKQLLRYRPELNIVWIVDRKRKDAPANVRVLLVDNIYDCMWESCSAKVWVTGLEILDECFKKRKDQIYVQVKHWSSLTLKTFGPESNEKVVSKEEHKRIVDTYIRNNAKMDVILSGSQFDEDSCRKGMLYSGDFVRVGSPRSDVMFDSTASKSVYEYIDDQQNVQLAMYAPTFRWPIDRSDPIHDLNLEMVYNSLRKRFGGAWKILLRLHPLAAEQARNIVLPAFVSNVSDYDDSEELVSAADVTITDYSSIMFEPAFLYKPVFLYAPDKEEYQKEHPLLMEYDKLPFSVSTDNQGLERAILEFNENDYKLKLQEMFDKYDVHEDGHASERAAMYILGLLDSKG